MSTTLLPAIRSKVGDWMTYVTSMSFKDIEKLVKNPDEIHERRGLSEWIQREAIDTHADQIASYIKETPQRFLGSLIIGVYDGNPNWAPLNINFTLDQLDVSEEQQQNMEGKLGLLHLSGEEKLFAIDGQHRVSGIKKALADDAIERAIEKDEISVIFVSHDESSIEGKQRTRRLFTTVNKKAKPVSKSATIALDEDNGFAIVTRNLIDQHWLFEDSRNHISYSSTGSIPSGDETTITSVVGLYEIVKDLWLSTNKKAFENTRPSEESLCEYYLYVRTFLDALLSQCSELNEVFVEQRRNARYYREESNHLLFRPVGQRAFARATQLLVQRGSSVEDAVTSLLQADMNISSQNWHHILWDPISETMITNKLAMAETQLLRLSGHDARTTRNQSNLEQILESIR
ncbi:MULTISPECIES: DNA sulfur modification protein DndB [Vibrio harveyi group]|uniref:DNA sulfur modification protein DndB n=1 Tax=Vibrio harveyi group TaxID=717610 RepID=UPI00235E5E96|nr:DNA sulfur modification protein DndB [Vibrio parahaemolyticus]ELB2944644.1 DGQHR domain-containing protein [Vibrio alginolyticus]MEA5291737.1 DNA sulfur modification protein DndB [Vibrio parahaemolyticus]